MAIRLVDWAIQQRPKPIDGVGPVATKMILILLANHARADGRAWPSVGTLADESRLADRWVREALAGLTAQGLITDTGDRAGATRRIKVWRLNADDDVQFSTGYKPDDSVRIESGRGRRGMRTWTPRNADVDVRDSNDDPSGNRQGTASTSSENRKPGPGHAPAGGKLRDQLDRMRKLAEDATKVVP